MSDEPKEERVDQTKLKNFEEAVCWFCSEENNFD